MLVKLLEAEVERRVGAFAAAGGGAVVSGHGGTSSMQYRDAADHNEALREAEMYSAPPPLSNRVVVKELSFRNLKDEYSEYDNEPSATSAAAPAPTAFTTPHQHTRKQQLATTPSSHKGTGGSSSSFSVLHPIQISAVQLVKRILDPVYVKGMITKQEYTDAVLSITTEGFSLAQRRELDLAPRSVDEEYEEEHDDHDDVGAGQQTLSSAFAAVLQEIADSVALHYTSRFDAAKEAADAVAHEAVRTTHSVSVRPHRSRSPSSSQPKHSVENTTTALLTTTTTTTAATSSTMGKRRSGSLGAASTNSSSHHCIGVDEDEAAFDAQVEHIRNLLSVSLGNRVAAPAATEPPAPETSNNNNTTEIINASPSSMRSRRKQMLESELKLLTLEMNTLAQRAYKIRDELANI
jgi:hypothetical protein